VIRRVPPNMFKFGAFEGQPDTAIRALVQDPTYSHRFDVKLGAKRAHGSTPFSSNGSFRNALLPVTIEIFSRLQSTSQEELRRSQRDDIADNAETALQALMYRHNLLVDANGTATGIVSGVLLGESGAVGAADWDTVSEDWDQQVHRSRISGAAIVVIDQNVS
jgi:hypothetical protein